MLFPFFATLYLVAVLNEYKGSVGFLIETANCNIIIPQWK